MKRNNVLILLLLVFVSVFAISIKKNKKDDKIKTNVISQNINSTPKNDNDSKQRLNSLVSIQRNNAITNAVKKVEPAVVSVNVIKTRIVRRYANPFNDPFFGFFGYVPYKQQIKGIGSGVIINEKGYIVTNAHVVEGATQIKIILPDSRDFDAKMIGIDTVHDIAVLKIKGDNLPYAELGDSSDLIIGEWSIAVGNPYGFLIKDSKPTVTVGVISATGRDFAPKEDGKIYKNMIQTDTAINPGNSGGPLVNVLGQVIGINSFIFSESGGSIGLGFAIPINTVKKITKELIEYGKIREIHFGFKIQNITPLIASYFHLKSSQGVIVVQLEKGGPAQKAGLKRGDIIIKINDTKIKNSQDAEVAVSDVTVGDKINITAKRNNKIVHISFVAKYR